ncbi:hypothetical protein N7450_001621 [Penicillium hetheringtonii]|uniref:Uncharacterized protein n=1 Tax=Penicillium hetheringtonii TaxID=911720 RepID=A0AAD6H1L0_9EURO|nr:hypothetical protein N7450_001621 [Penicillium hetheringtonii]
MAKAKGMKEGKNAKSHLKARMGFLEKAANYLQAAKTTGKNIDEVSETDETSQMSRNADYTSTKENAKTEVGTRTPRTIQAPSSNLSRVYISQMYGVSLKTLTRLPIQTKRVVKPPLSSGTTCTIETQNASRGRKKPWADVMVIRCLVCGTEKRFPETGRRSQKLLERRQLI